MVQPDRPLHPRFASQFAVLQAAALRLQNLELRYGFAVGTEPGSAIPDYVYEDKVVLVPTDRLGEIVTRNDRSNMEQDGSRGVRGRRNRRSDISVLRILDGEEVPDAVERLAALDGIGRGVVTPNHVISICPGATNICPGGEPRPAMHPPVPPDAPGNTGAGVRVQVVDTGVWEGYRSYPWFADVAGDLAFGLPPVEAVVVGQQEVENPIAGPWEGDPLGFGGIREYFGHGVFVAGVLRCVAPGANVHVANALTLVGAATEIDIGTYLVDLMQAEEGQPDIINLSAGSKDVNGNVHQGLLAFVDELLAPECETLLVAAAGNDGSTQKFFPAGSAPGSGGAIVSVGALREDGRGRACFSNYGDWVDVFAPGENLVNAFPTGRYQYIDPKAEDCHNYTPHRYSCTCLTAANKGDEVDFKRYARWSGTSFAAPYVAGLVATRMDRTGESPRTAAAGLLAEAETRLDLTDVVEGQPYDEEDLTQIRVLPPSPA